MRPEKLKSCTVLKFFGVLSKFAFDIDDEAILGPGRKWQMAKTSHIT